MLPNLLYPIKNKCVQMVQSRNVESLLAIRCSDQNQASTDWSKFIDVVEVGWRTTQCIGTSLFLNSSTLTFRNCGRSLNRF